MMFPNLERYLAGLPRSALAMLYSRLSLTFAFISLCIYLANRDPVAKLLVYGFVAGTFITAAFVGFYARKEEEDVRHL